MKRGGKKRIGGELKKIRENDIGREKIWTKERPGQDGRFLCLRR